MNRDDVIRWAREAGISRLPDNWGDGWWQADSTAELERFAIIVAAAEREACAKVCDELQDVPATEPRHCAKDIRARGQA